MTTVLTTKHGDALLCVLFNSLLKRYEEIHCAGHPKIGLLKSIYLLCMEIKESRCELIIINCEIVTEMRTSDSCSYSIV